MKLRLILPLLTLVTLTTTAAQAQQRGGGRQQQRQEEPEAPLAKVPLSPKQVEVISKQLAELEKQIQEMRGSSLSGVMAKLRAAAASEAAALNFVIDCEKIVEIERKDLDKTVERERKEQKDRQAERAAQIEEERRSGTDMGDLGRATKLMIDYLILTLEAHETKPEDKSKMVPKLQAYIQDLVASAEKLKGRAGQMLSRGVGGGAVVEALQIERFVQGGDGWTNSPMDISGMFDNTIMPAYLAEGKKEALAGLWDSRISAMTALNKGRMPEPEFMIWGQQELPPIKWQRAKYLVNNGPSPVNAMAEMLAHIKAYPGHPDAPSWLEEISKSIEASKESEGAATATPPASGSGN